jgi:hypothetical protein
MVFVSPNSPAYLRRSPSASSASAAAASPFPPPTSHASYHGSPTKPGSALAGGRSARSPHAFSFNSVSTSLSQIKGQSRPFSAQPTSSVAQTTSGARPTSAQSRVHPSSYSHSGNGVNRLNAAWADADDISEHPSLGDGDEAGRSSPLSASGDQGIGVDDKNNNATCTTILAVIFFIAFLYLCLCLCLCVCDASHLVCGPAEARYIEVIKRLKRGLEQEQKKLRTLRQQHAATLAERTDLETLLKQCVDEVKRDMAHRATRRETHAIINHSPHPAASSAQHAHTSQAVTSSLIQRQRHLHAPTSPTALSRGVLTQGRDLRSAVAGIGGSSRPGTSSRLGTSLSPPSSPSSHMSPASPPHASVTMPALLDTADCTSNSPLCLWCRGKHNCSLGNVYVMVCVQQLVALSVSGFCH